MQLCQEGQQVSPGPYISIFRLKLIVPSEISGPPLGTSLGVTLCLLEMSSNDEASIHENPDDVLDLAIDYATRGGYPEGLSKDKKQAVRRRAATLRIDKGETLLKRKSREVKVVTDAIKQRRIVESCHSDPTSGHFGVTKTWRRAAEQFYWRGMSSQVKKLVI